MSLDPRFDFRLSLPRIQTDGKRVGQTAEARRSEDLQDLERGHTVFIRDLLNGGQ